MPPVAQANVCPASLELTIPPSARNNACPVLMALRHLRAPKRRSSAPYRVRPALGPQPVERLVPSVKQAFTTTRLDLLASKVANGAQLEVLPTNLACEHARSALPELTMKSLEECRRLLVSDARLEHSVPLLDLLPDIIVSIVLTIHSTPKRALLALASARNAPTDCRHRPALILKTNAFSSALVACGPVLGMFLIVSRAKLEHPPQQAPNF